MIKTRFDIEQFFHFHIIVPAQDLVDNLKQEKTTLPSVQNLAHCIQSSLAIAESEN